MTVEPFVPTRIVTQKPVLTMGLTSHHRPHRVLYLVNSLRAGGAERDVATICRHIDQHRVRPEVMTLVDGGQFKPMVIDAGVKVTCLQRRRAYDPFFVLWAARMIARRDVDLVHIYAPVIGVSAALAKAVWRAKHPLLYTELTSIPQVGIKGILHRWALKRFTAFASNSLASRETLVREGLKEDNIRLMPNGHDLERFQRPRFDRDAVRSEFGIRANETMAIYVGRLIPSKRVCDLVEAWGTLKSDQRIVHLVIVGEGPELDALKRRMVQLGLDNIQFVGVRRDVPQLLRSADLFVFPSVVEGLPNSVIEAALAGLPIVACDIGGVRDVVRDGDYAYLVPGHSPARISQAIREVLDHPEPSRIRATAAQKYAETKYDIKRVLERMYEYYDEILTDQRISSIDG